MRTGKLLAILILLIISFWTIRIVNINRNNGITQVIAEEGEAVQTEYISICAIESGLYSFEKFKKEINEKAYLEEQDDVLWVKLRVTNISEIEISWSWLFDSLMGNGFQADNWLGASDASLTRDITLLYSEKFCPGDQIEVYMAAPIPPEHFTEENRKNIKAKNFCWIISTYPDRKILKLDLGA